MTRMGTGTRFLHAGQGRLYGLRVGPYKSFLRPLEPLRPIGSVAQVHETKAKVGDDELISFLTEEIATEKKNVKTGPLPTNLEGFDVQTNLSEITLTKKFNNEQITITLNVNHTVDADYSEDVDPSKQGEKEPEMRSRPSFEIDVKKGTQTLNFSCSYLQGDSGASEPQQQQDEYQDAFVIDEISLYDGEWDDGNYAVAGDILDGYLYDLFMNMLEERGITNEFVEKVSDYATDYEHKQYISLLSKLQNFLGSK